MTKQETIVLTALLSSLVLTGCAADHDIIEQQKTHTQKISQLDRKIDTLESELQKQEMTNRTVSQAVHELSLEQGKLKTQAEQQEEKWAQEKTVYTIKEGDTLFSISRETGVSLEVLFQLNPQIESPKRLLIGDKINIK